MGKAVLDSTMSIRDLEGFAYKVFLYSALLNFLTALVSAKLDEAVDCHHPE